MYACISITYVHIYIYVLCALNILTCLYNKMLYAWAWKKTVENVNRICFFIFILYLILTEYVLYSVFWFESS